MNNEEWFTVQKVVTNTVEGSVVDVDVNVDRICPNMTNKEFRAKFAEAQNEAVSKIEVRLAALASWNKSEQERVRQWFGRNDEATRARLQTGLAKVLTVVRGFGPHNIVRSGDAGDLATGCTPNPRGTNAEAAHVCAPDTATHTIAISQGFCTMRQGGGGGDSRVSTIIHEATHFLDTMATTDEQYTITRFLGEWGQRNPDLAIKNADSVAGYCVWMD
jgi:hypothetical protein